MEKKPEDKIEAVKDEGPTIKRTELQGKLRETLAYLSGLSHFNNMVISEPALRAAKGHMYVVQAAIDALAPGPVASQASDDTEIREVDELVPAAVVEYLHKPGWNSGHAGKLVYWSGNHPGTSESSTLEELQSRMPHRVAVAYITAHKDSLGRPWRRLMTKTESWYEPTYLTVVNTPKPAPPAPAPSAYNVPHAVVGAMRKSWTGVYYGKHTKKIEPASVSRADAIRQWGPGKVFHDPHGRPWLIIEDWYFPEFNHAWPA